MIFKTNKCDIWFMCDYSFVCQLVYKERLSFVRQIPNSDSWHLSHCYGYWLSISLPPDHELFDDLSHDLLILISIVKAHQIFIGWNYNDCSRKPLFQPATCLELPQNWIINTYSFSCTDSGFDSLILCKLSDPSIQLF